MSNTFSYCDHIVYCCTNLLEGIKFIEFKTGLTVTFGGRHLTKGTHNALFKIGANTYFEILAIDPDNTDVKGPRWMGIDLIKSSKITRWAIKTDKISSQAKILTDYNQEYGNVQSGSRALSDNTQLTWKLTDPLTKPEVEVMPFLLDWEESIHPSTKLEQHAALVAIDLSHPNPNAIKQGLEQLGVPLTIQQQSNPSIKVTLDTPKGFITL